MAADSGRILRRALPALGLLLAAASAQADDTDIYSSSILPANSVPLVMFTLDNSTDAAAIYAGCSNVGTGTDMCAAAQYFRDNCPNCALPAATAPLTYFHVMRYAIRMVVEQQAGMKIGLMLNHRHSNNCAGPRPVLPSSQQRCSNGAYIARGFKLLDRVTIPGNPLLGTSDISVLGPNTQEFLTILDSLPLPSVAAHSYQGKELFFELFRYLTGQALYNGHNGYTDYGTDNSQNLDQDNPAIDWDASVEAAGLYVSPLTADLTCTRVFTVNFLLQASSQDSDSDDAIDSELPGGMIGLDLRPPNNRFESVVSYLHDVDLARATLPFGTVPNLSGKQNVTSYFFTLPTPANSNPPTFDRTLTEYAAQGGTTRPQGFTENPATVVEQLRNTMNQILSVSTTFVSASVPVNVFSRTQLLNDVYVALFQPDIAAKPFWVGNLKKLKSQVYEVPCPANETGCVATQHVRLVDALGADAIDDDGRLRNSALTFWTDGSGIAADAMRGVQAGRDGRFVNLGGAGQRIPGFLSAAPGHANTDLGARQLYLYPGTGNALVPLSTDVSASVAYTAPLGAVDATEALRILKHIRGYDEYDQDGDLNTTEVRPWLMADPLHSRPVAINYGALSGYSETNPAIFIAIATNDGFMHFIRNTTTAGAESGVEAWAVLPVDLMAIQKALAVNTALSKRLYGLDGAPTAWILDNDHDGTIEAGDGDKVYLYFGLRRGGRAYYALDVTDPLAPQFLWRITPTSRATRASGDAATTDFAGLGLTFSQPKLARVKTGTDTSGNPIIKQAVVFAGGYDAVANDYPAATLTAYKAGGLSPGSINTDDTMGNAIYVVDAETGELIWKAVGPIGGVLATGNSKVFAHAGLKDSIPSTVTVVDTNGDSLTDRIIVGDSGGNVWRADLGEDRSSPLDRVTTDDWTLSLLAQLGRHAGSGKLNDRRFFHEPDYVLSQDERGPFDAIVIGSGDREDPLDYGRERATTGVETITENAFYVLKDYRVATYSRDDTVDGYVPMTPPLLADVTDNCTQDTTIATCTPEFSYGWQIRLTEGRGEKVLAAALTAANRIYFSSFLPPRSNEATTCGPSEGGGLFYAVGLKKGTAVFNYNTADCPATGCGGSGQPNSAKDRFDPLASAGIPADVVYINVADGSGGEVKCALGSDLNCRALPGATRFRTFWFKDE